MSKASRASAAGPLSGIVVIDATNFLGGPFAGMLLADMGADVIKLEAPPGGDPSRKRHDNTGYSSAFAGVNRTKRSVLMDLKNPAARPALEALIARADVFLTSLRPRSRPALGLDYKRLSALNPKLVYCSVTGYGERGPGLDVPAFDTTAQARSGLLYLVLGDVDQEVRMTAFLSDLMAGIYACNGVLGAIIARGRTGKGQEVRTSLLQASLGMATFNFYTMFAAQAVGESFTSIRPAGYFLRGSDDKRFACHVPPSPEGIWINFLAALEMPWLREDERYQTIGARAKNYPQLHATIAKHVATKPRAYWMERLTAHDVAYAPINRLHDVFDDPVVQGLGMLHGVADPWGKVINTVSSGVEFSDTPAVMPTRAPLAGEHNRAVMRWAGFSETDIDDLERQGVLQSRLTR